MNPNLFGSLEIAPGSQLAALRDSCISPIPIYTLSYSTYDTKMTDSIYLTQLLGGVDWSRVLEAEKTISESWDIKPDITRFVANGGTFVVSPSYEAVKQFNHFKVHIRPEDLVIPMCHEGMNRSQLMYLVQHALKSKSGDRVIEPRVTLPHGACSGFDPYQGYSDLDETTWYKYIHGKIHPLSELEKSGDWMHVNFYRAFGVEKARRIGQEFSESSGLELNKSDSSYILEDFVRLANDRQIQRKFMDEQLYNTQVLKSYASGTGTGAGAGAPAPSPPSCAGRIVLICFCRSASIFLHRLLEVSGSQDMSNIVIIALPYPDVISRAGGRDEIEKHVLKTGHSITRDELSIRCHLEEFTFYAGLFKLVALRSC